MLRRGGPPRLAELWLRRMISDEHACEDVLGDLHEEYARASKRFSAVGGCVWYWFAAAATVGWYLWEGARRRRALPRGEGKMKWVIFDAKLTFRSMRRSPIFTITAIFTLALGIGGTTAIFSVVNGVLLKPLPLESPDELVAVLHTAPGIGKGSIPMSPATYFTYREDSQAFDDIGLWDHARVTVTGLAEPERIKAMQVTDRLFPLLRVSPLMGRGYTSEDVSPGSTYPVILSYGYWQRRFGGDSGVLGQTIRLNGSEVQIVGVMPRGLRFDTFDPALYLPLVFNRSTVSMGPYSFQGIARLRPGVTIEEANRDVARLNPIAAERFGGSQAEMDDMGFGTVVRPLKDSMVGDVQTVLWVLFVTVGLVLLIACANVANLFLVRAESRQRDIAVRTAIGASRGRVAGQFLIESLTLGLLGGVAGLALAGAGLRLLIRIAPDNLPRLHEISVDPVVLLFTLGLASLAGLLFGLFPVFNYSNPNLVMALKQGGRGASDGRQRHRLRNVLAVSQVALALTLLIGSGLMIRSFQALRSVKPGFERPEEVLTVRLSIPRSEAAELMDAARMHERIIERLAQIPGVRSVSAAASVAMERWDWWGGVFLQDFPVAEDAVTQSRRYNWIAADYFSTLENPLLAGRSITWDDIHNRRPVVVVTENFTRTYWDSPAQAVGRWISEDRDGPWREIVGVVGNVHTTGVGNEPPEVVYFPMVTGNFGSSEVFAQRDMRFAIRTSRQRAEGLLPEVRQAVWSINPNLPLAGVQTLEQIRNASMQRTSFILIMLGIAAAVALLLGTVGVYGVISYIVAQRTREIGVRMALGARRVDVSRLVLRQGGRIAVAGIAIGLAAALGLTRLMSALLYGVNPVDLVTYAAVSLALGGIALLATYIPARRAAGVDPAEALRWE